MTKDDTKNDVLKEDPPPFYVVLIDLKKAGEHRKIRCVKRRLPSTDDHDDDLNYVALSYRWGEVQKTTIDTGVGYLATITSFDLDHFFQLCKTILHEDTMHHIQYVWVDAICVNQTNHEQRKATIYQMTNIYHRANYILAVPDLHLRYLTETSEANKRIINNIKEYSGYIYHLIQGNMDELYSYDRDLLRRAIGNVPGSRPLKHLFTTHTRFLTPGLTTCRPSLACEEEGHLPFQRHYDNNENDNDDDHDTTKTLTMDEWHMCNGVQFDRSENFETHWGGFDLGRYRELVGSQYDFWQENVPERSQTIRQSMVFFNGPCDGLVQTCVGGERISYCQKQIQNEILVYPTW